MKKYVAGEMCETLCDHWGAADDISYKSVTQIIEELCNCRKIGANFLLNIGPNADGTVPKIQEAIMECIGKWMAKYGEAIYNGRPYIVYENTPDFILKHATDEKTGYLFKFKPGQSGGDVNVTLNPQWANVSAYNKVDKQVESMRWLDTGDPIDFQQEGETLEANLHGYLYGTQYHVRVAEIKFK
jgi:alpha-L-fucosidase